MISGSCLCGGVRYEIDGDLGPVAMCHCGMCRKASGSAFATNASVDRDRFRLLAGADLIQRYESSPGDWRSFCRVCGSPVYKEMAVAPQQLRIRLGLLDSDPGVRPAFHYAVNYKAPWFEIHDDLPRLEHQ